MDTIVGQIGECSNPRHVTGLEEDQAKTGSESLSADALRTLGKGRGCLGRLR